MVMYRAKRVSRSILGIPCLPFCFAGYLLISNILLHGQTITGTIRGTVTDPSNAVVVGAEVSVHNEQTNASRRSRTSDAGEFDFPELPLGVYRIAVRSPGFKEATAPGIELHVASTVVVRVKMVVGTIHEQAEVEVSPIQVETESGEVAGLIRGTQVRELPLNGRSFVQLTQLMPGVTASDGFDPKNKGLFAGNNLMSVSGGSSGANLWTVDGANNNDVGSNHTILISPSIDAIEEFKIHRNAYGPEYGQSGGGQINIVTRSGGNTFHGSAFYFGRNDALNARDYFLGLSNAKKQALRRNDFGYTFGGPILKDKLFFFWEQEWNKEKRGVVRTAQVPTVLEKHGNFSGPASGCGHVPAPIDPTTGQAFEFPGPNIIPSDQLSPAGLLYLQLYSDPNVSDPNACLNWIAAIDTPINWRQENIRGDYNLNTSLTLMVRYTQDAWENPAPSYVEQLVGDDQFPVVDSNWDQNSRMLVAKLTKAFGSSTVNSFQFSWSANRIQVSNGGTHPELIPQINAAIPTFFPLADKQGGEFHPHMLFFPSQGYGFLGHIAPWNNRQDLHVWRDDFSKVAGKHNWKAGILYSRNAKDELTLPFNAEFGATPGALPGTATGNAIADFLWKGSRFLYFEGQREVQTRMRWRDYELYAGDTWRVSRNLTLDHGVRWSFLRWPFDAEDQFASFNPAKFDPGLGSAACNGLEFPSANPCPSLGLAGGSTGINRSLQRNRNNLIAPRLGIAWDVTGSGKTAVRAGVGEFFNREHLQTGGASNPPFSSSVSFVVRPLDANCDPNTDPNCPTPGFGTPSSGLDPSGLLPNTWQWNLTVERELWRNTKLEVGYVGSRGIHLLSFSNVMQVPEAGRLEFARHPNDNSLQASLRPFGAAFGNQNLPIIGHHGDSIYHSLQTQLTSRLQRDSIVQLSYTFSRLITTTALTEFNPSDQEFSDNARPWLDRGLSPFHRPHVFSASMVYDLPTLAGHNSLLRYAAGGWEVGTIVQEAMGTALTFSTGGLPLSSGIGLPSGTGRFDTQRPNRAVSEPCRAPRGVPYQWINPNVVTLAGFQLGSIGTASRGMCQGPGNNQIDLSLYKNFDLPVSRSHFSDGLKLQFRVEFFNAFNHTQFKSVDTGYNPSTVGLDNPTLDALGNASNATRILSASPSGTFGQATATRGPREIQYGLKLIF